MERPKMFLLCGLIGSGKSYWSRIKLAAGGNIICVNRDSLRTMISGGVYVYNKRLEIVGKSMAVDCVVAAHDMGYSVILDETNLTVKKRSEWLSMALACGMEVICVHCTETVENLANRMTEPRGMPEARWSAVLEGMRESFEPPTMKENFSRIEVVEIPPIGDR